MTDRPRINGDMLDALDFKMSPGCVLAQLGGLAGIVGWFSERYAHLRDRHWPSVLGWNLALGSILTKANR